MDISKEPDHAKRKPGVVTAITWVVCVFMFGWLLDCAMFEINSATTSGEIIQHEVFTRRTRRPGTVWEEQEITVLYSDSAGRQHKATLSFWGQLPQNNRIAVRYAKHRPADGRLDGFWPVWGFWTMSAATLLLTAGIAKLKMHKCGLDWDGRPLVKKP
jgi:hypothetical protein